MDKRIVLLKADFEELGFLQSQEGSFDEYVKSIDDFTWKITHFKTSNVIEMYYTVSPMGIKHPYNICISKFIIRDKSDLKFLIDGLWTLAVSTKSW